MKILWEIFNWPQMVKLLQNIVWPNTETTMLNGPVKFIHLHMRYTVSYSCFLSHNFALTFSRETQTKTNKLKINMNSGENENRLCVPSHTPTAWLRWLIRSESYRKSLNVNTQLVCSFYTRKAMTVILTVFTFICHVILLD